MPSDAAGRKVHEQNVVVWVEDTHVKLCPSCARGFHMARRKHHCRLCGAIMCNDCSYFLTVPDAKTMITASNIGKQVETNNTELPDLRLCEPCHQRLNHRQQLQDSRTAWPIISQYYDKLQNYRDNATSLLPEYHKMCASLCSGESLHHLSDAQYLRVKLIKLAEAMDSTSKAILVLGGTPSGRSQRLQQAIRSSSTIFIRDELVGLPSLPTEAQLKLLQEKHKHVIEMRLQNKPSTSRAPQVVANSGWGPATTDKLLLDSDDIMVQQMNILKNYIKQAREAHKDDEVSMLESNLRELQEEYWRQQEHSTK
jgi:rabenosyn-5